MLWASRTIVWDSSRRELVCTAQYTEQSECASKDAFECPSMDNRPRSLGPSLPSLMWHSPSLSLARAARYSLQDKTYRVRPNPCSGEEVEDDLRHRNGYPGRDSEKIDGDRPPEHGFDEATNVMESGLLRTLTDESARQGGSGDAEIVADAPPAAAVTQDHAAPPRERQASEAEAPPSTTPSVAPPRRRSRVFWIAGAVAAGVLTFDAWLVTHHRRPTRPPPAAPSAPSNALPTYALLPLGTPPPAAPAPREMPAAVPANVAVVEEAAPTMVAPTSHRHRHGHHRH